VNATIARVSARGLWLRKLRLLGLLADSRRQQHGDRAQLVMTAYETGFVRPGWRD
jgi:ribosomal protein L13E